jgi:hypothetical protein
MSERYCSWQRAIAILRRKMRVGVGFAAGVAVLAAVASGCAAVGGGLAKDSPAAVKEAAVAERAKARWQLLIKRDYEGAYGYFSPSSREATTLSKFEASIRQIEYRAVNIEKVECMAEACKVTLTLTYDFAPAKIKGVVTLLDESWIIDRGQAWFVFRG